MTWDDVVKAATEFAPKAREYLAKAGQGLKAGQAVLDDPYFGEGMCQVLRLQALNAGKDPGPACPRTVSTPIAERKGIGLRYVMTPLRAVVYTRQNRWAAPLAITAIVALPFAVGYLLGKSGGR